MSRVKNLRNQTTYFENEKQWLCSNCFTINPNTWPECEDCRRIKGVFQIIRKEKKYLTVKEWKKFRWFKKEQVNGVIFYMDMEMLLIQKYDIILTDWKSKKEKAIIILKKFNLKNLDKGIKSFDKGIKDFNKSISGIGEGVGKTRDLSVLIEKKPKKSRKKKQKKKKKKRSRQKKQKNRYENLTGKKDYSALIGRH